MVTRTGMGQNLGWPGDGEVIAAAAAEGVETVLCFDLERAFFRQVLEIDAALPSEGRCSDQ
jgi:hypothetical protein